VVVLEDDEMVAYAQTHLFAATAGQVRHFPNAEEALRHEGELDADYFIVDYSLGGALTGYEFLKTLQQKRPDRYAPSSSPARPPRDSSPTSRIVPGRYCTNRPA